ncbi:PREDICTED: myomesin-2 [Dipodomys ordii]|uniref:Myomesin-2 n=1 Tax=Dipodomys ordii TaxID=10020 RepID=A0A1S3FTH5_DIPOR|nr:PREDICTED: myomesin-2 [Dipodomys ordii]
MSLVALPFYQKRHKHFDQSYRSIQTRYLLNEYASRKRASSQTSAQSSLQQRSSAQSTSSRSSARGATCQLCAKRASASEEEEREHEHRYHSQAAAYGEAKRQRFLGELAQLGESVQQARSQARTTLDQYSLQRSVGDRLEWERHAFEERMSRAPEILVRLRSHTIWEKMSVRLCFTVQGFPTPVVQWYKDGSLICQAGEPGKYRIESNYGVHTLEINRPGQCDEAVAAGCSASSSPSALAFQHVQRPAGGCLHEGVAASLFGGRFRGDEEPFHSVGLPIGLPLSTVIPYTHFDVQFLEKFGVTFRREGETVTLKCTLLVTPDLKRVHPRAEWYHDGKCHGRQYHSNEYHTAQATGRAATAVSTVLVSAAAAVQAGMAVDGGPSAEAPGQELSLSISTDVAFTSTCYQPARVKPRMRWWLGAGRGSLNSAALALASHTSDVHTSPDADPPVTGAPGAPMDLKCHDANRDYVIVTWKPPNTTTESPVIGYFIDRCEVGTSNWVQCNDAPVKICKYPVTGLFEGRSYVFRVRAVNSAGVSRPSRVSEAVAALDPTDLKRLQAIHLEGEKEIVIYQDDLEGDVNIPGPPTNVQASEVSRNYVVLSWEPPSPRGKDPLMYFIEKSAVGSGSWQRVNAQTAVRSPRYAVFDLAEGKPYVFRVLSANKHGLSDPSEITAPIQVQDSIAVPSSPGRVLASRNTKTSVVVQWDRPKQEEDLLGYYVDCCVAGTNQWEPCNHKPIGYNRFVVHGLSTGEQYIFRVKAVNAVGASENSQESEVIKVQAALTAPSHPYGITLLNCDGLSMTLGWKVPRFSGGSAILGYYLDKREALHKNWHEVNPSPVQDRIFTVGPAYDLTFCEVRNTSLVMLWKAPVYAGSSPVSGYLVDFKEKDAGEWKTVTEAATPNRYLKVCGLQQGQTYVFRVRAVNASGPGKPSDTSEPVLVEARPGTKEVSAGVDEQGDIYLEFDCQEMTDASLFTWCKSYEEIADEDRFRVHTEGDRSRLYFMAPDKVDIGTYSVSVSDTDGVSSSFVLDEEGKSIMAQTRCPAPLSPALPLKSDLAYEILEKGQVRFWLQAEPLSADASFRFVVNDREVSDSETHRIKCDKSTGLIEMVMDRFTIENEGTYTVQIQDGKAKSQSSLVLIGDAFKAVLEEAEFQRKEFLRKQGPHFAEYLHWDVTDECEVRLLCKVANTKKETVFKWLKDDVLYETETLPDLERGVCELLIPKLSKKDHGEYKATLKDDRGQDVSILEIAGQVYEDMILAMSRVCGASASPLKVLCTPEGIRLQCFMKYFTEEMKINWYHKDAKISSSEHMRVGGSEEMAWLQICEPSEKDKGKYTFEIFDGKDNHQRSLDLSGQAFDEAFAEFQQLKAAAFAEKNRGKVIGGLPDVVTIMEGKTLNLTCTVFGNPDPEVVWFKNDKDIELSEHFAVKVEQSKYVSLTISGVTAEDSGKYSINVKNKYGGEKIDVTVSVYKHGEKIPELSAPQQAKPKLIPASTSAE